jgi:hypothetical protein
VEERLNYGFVVRSANARNISRRRASLAAGHSEISPMVRRQPMHNPRASSRQISMQGDFAALLLSSPSLA